MKTEIVAQKDVNFEKKIFAPTGACLIVRTMNGTLRMFQVECVKSVSHGEGSREGGQLCCCCKAACDLHVTETDSVEDTVQNSRKVTHEELHFRLNPYSFCVCLTESHRQRPRLCARSHDIMHVERYRAVHKESRGEDERVGGQVR